MQFLEYFKNHFVLNHQNYLGDRPKNGISKHVLQL